MYLLSVFEITTTQLQSNELMTLLRVKNVHKFVKLDTVILNNSAQL